MTDPTWRTRARCRGLDPEIFYPGVGESAAEAKAVCVGCPVQADCLEYALDTWERHGIWGGRSERERRKIRRERNRAARAARIGAAA